MLFDTHAHLDQEEFNADRAEVIARAVATGVDSIVAVGVTAESSAAVVKLAAEYPMVYAAVGIQPNYCGQAQQGDWERIVELASSPKVVAIGETGLDRYWDYTPFTVQQDYFGLHIRLAHEMNLPFIVHTRESDVDVLQELHRFKDYLKVVQFKGVMHSFTGAAETAAECIQMGLYISFAGMVTFKKSNDLRAVAATVPMDRILIETDSPYLSPHPLRGKRNEPANLIHTAAVLAGVRGITVEEFAEQTTANAKALFGLA